MIHTARNRGADPVSIRIPSSLRVHRRHEKGDSISLHDAIPIRGPEQKGVQLMQSECKSQGKQADGEVAVGTGLGSDSGSHRRSYHFEE